MTADQTTRTLTRRGERRRAALLDAATTLFMDRGFAGTSLEDVIAVAGGSRRTIYDAFGNKEGLFAAAVQSVLDRALEPLGDLDLDDGPIDAALVRAGEAFVRMLTTQEAFALFRIVLSEVDHLPALGQMLFERGPEQAYAIVGSYLHRQAAAGYLRLDDPEATARHLLEMMKGDLHLRGLLTPGWTPDEAMIHASVTRAVAVFLDGARS